MQQENLVNVGPPKTTRFEKARIVGARALQISMGAPILVDAEENTNPIDIAVTELNAKYYLLPYIGRCLIVLSRYTFKMAILSLFSMKKLFHGTSMDACAVSFLFNITIVFSRDVTFT